MADHVQRKWRYVWRWRLAAIALGCVPLLLTEWTLAVFDLPKHPAAIDPYVDLHHLRPLFSLDSSTDQMVIGPERMHLFRPASFPVKKSPETFRVFALGGSTTQGEPYSTETAFPEWLKLNLQAQSPDANFEVINCGGLSYASYRVLAILCEVLQYEPDLIVIYTGQNEFLERRTYANWMRTSPRSDTVAWLAQFRTVQLARTWFAKPAVRAEAPSRTALAAEVDALLDYSGGLEEYRRDDPWRAPVVEHFRWNLEQMIHVCQQSHVPLILVRPVSNLIDCPPFKFEVNSTLSAEQQAEFTRGWEAICASRNQQDDPLSVVNHLLAIDDQHAGALFLKGRILADRRDWEAAKPFFIAARDADVCPLRAISKIANAVSELAERFDVPIVDAEQILCAVSEHGIPGSQWMVDHVHPTIEGHQLIGESLAETCLTERFVKPETTDWRSSRRALYQEHFKHIGEEYFHRGKQRLEGLMLWTQGRAKKLKSAD